MSGGSYSYFSSKSSDEQLSSIAYYADNLIADMRSMVGEGIAYNEAFEHDKTQPYERPVTALERFACDSGYGDGSGSGYGYGYGDGSGYGSDLWACKPIPVRVTDAHLKTLKACADHVALFRKTFPGGGIWPDDIDKAAAAGLDVNWARENFIKLGFLEPL